MCAIGRELLNKWSFSEVVMQCEVTRCIICIFNKVESLNKENSYKSFTKNLRNAIKNILDKISCHNDSKNTKKHHARELFITSL